VKKLQTLFAHVRNQWAGFLALFLVIAGGTAYAANTVGSADVINESLLSQDIKNGEVKGADIAVDSIGGTRVVDDSLGGKDIKESSLNLPGAHVCRAPGGVVKLATPPWDYGVDLPPDDVTTTLCQSGSLSVIASCGFEPGAGARATVRIATTQDHSFYASTALTGAKEGDAGTTASKSDEDFTVSQSPASLIDDLATGPVYPILRTGRVDFNAGAPDDSQVGGSVGVTAEEQPLGGTVVVLACQYATNLTT
jgi:hypothetical protein